MNITIKEAYALRAKLIEMTPDMSDKVALICINLYPVWSENIEYAVGNRVRYNNVLYRVLHEHTSRVGMEPNVCDMFEKVVI